MNLKIAPFLIASPFLLLDEVGNNFSLNKLFTKQVSLYIRQICKKSLFLPYVQFLGSLSVADDCDFLPLSQQS